MKRPFHKMTTKAAKARELCAEICGIDITQMRKDRPAIHGMYAELEDRGFEWVSAKQEWALVDTGVAAYTENTAYFVTAAEGVTAAEALYILTEGLKAAGYEVAETHTVFNALDPSSVLITFQVKL